MVSDLSVSLSSERGPDCCSQPPCFQGDFSPLSLFPSSFLPFLDCSSTSLTPVLRQALSSVDAQALSTSFEIGLLSLTSLLLFLHLPSFLPHLHFLFTLGITFQRQMATVAAIPMPTSRGHTPMVSTFDPSFSPAGLHLSPYAGSNASPNSGFSYPSSPSMSNPAIPMGSRYEKVPYSGPGSATYVRQPTRAQLVSRFPLSHEDAEAVADSPP